VEGAKNNGWITEDGPILLCHCDGVLWRTVLYLRQLNERSNTWPAMVPRSALVGVADLHRVCRHRCGHRTWKACAACSDAPWSLAVLNILFLHLAGLITQLHNPGPWTVTFELLALCGVSFVLANLLPPDELTTSTGNVGSSLATAGRFAFAISLIVFAVQHFIYARFIATLIPSWIPVHVFWAYFIGVAFLGAALAIAAKVQAKLATILLGTMFLLWVLVLHLPRVAAAPSNGNEVTSLFIALAMSGASFILASSLTHNPSV
jgi:uncharacterized membrane protein